MNQMFLNAARFNQDICGWDMSSVTSSAQFLDGTSRSAICVCTATPGFYCPDGVTVDNTNKVGIACPAGFFCRGGTAAPLALVKAGVCPWGDVDYAYGFAWNSSAYSVGAVGTAPSARVEPGFAEGDGRLYVFGGRTSTRARCLPCLPCVPHAFRTLYRAAPSQKSLPNAVGEGTSTC